MKQINHSEYQRKLKKKSVAELKYIISDATEASKALQSEFSNVSYYQDEIIYASVELKKRAI